MRLSSSRGRAPLLALLLVVAAPRAAHADGDTAEAHLQAGIALRREHKNEEALAEFRLAYQKASTPRARAQMGFAEQALARWVDAENDLRAALAASDDKWIVRSREPIESALRAIDDSLGWLTVATADAHAAFAIDGVALPDGAPTKRRIAVGAHTVRITPSDGREASEAQVDVVAHQEVRVVLLGAPSSRGTSAAAAESPRDFEWDDPFAARPATVAPPVAPARVAGYAIAAVGVGGVATSLVLGAFALHERSVVGAHCPDRRCDTDGLAAAQVGSSLAMGATIAFAVGFVALGAGATLIIAAPSPRAPASAGVALRIPLP